MTINKKRYLIFFFSYPSLKDLFIFFNDFKTLLNDFNDYEALSTSLKQALAYDLAFFTQNLNIIKEWLYSKEFKQNYQDKNHPYPSLLNPNKIDYENIPAELAWEMNLPLPRRYEFLLMRGHGSGGTAMMSFLGKCKVKLAEAYYRHLPKNTYFKTYNFLLKNPNTINFICIAQYDGIGWIDNNGYARNKIFALTNKKVPILFQVRDPIGHIKHGRGRIWGKLKKLGKLLFVLTIKIF